MMIDREEVQRIKEQYPQGTRVELDYMDDANAVESGTKGTVAFVDDIGTIHVQWDNGRKMGVCLEVDSIHKI